MVSALNLGNYTYVPPGPPLIFLLEVLFKYSDGYWLVEGLDSRVATILTKLHYSLSNYLIFRFLILSLYIYHSVPHWRLC